MPEYTAHATTVAGRNGHVESSDGVLKLDLTLPKEVGGPGKPDATNPEQLFAAGYSACFGGAVGAVAAAEKVKTGAVSVTADVTLHVDPGPNFYISVKLGVKIEGVDRETAERLVHKAHEVCPYSKATRNNVKVELAVL
jgi:osmotically inducible protein OsmC